MRETTSVRPAVLLLEDDEIVRITLKKLISRRTALAEVIGVSSVSAAAEVLGSRGGWACLVLDYALPDGNGLDVLQHARGKRIEAPAIILTGSVEKKLINRAASLRATFVCKPDLDIVGEFAARSLLDYDDMSTRIEGAVTDVAGRFDLTAAEAMLLTSALRGVSRDEFMRKRGISANTYKTQAKGLLSKMDHDSISGLCNDVLRSLLLRSS
jgi:DNA-binding NarL/FixJ family response regulator